MGEIYKITNNLDGRVYIGQVMNKSSQKRFKRHCGDRNGRLHSHIDRALEKYGAENFTLQVLDTAETKEELDEKERIWIDLLDATNPLRGYNLTKGGDGGDTYMFKTEEEMETIREKIRLTKVGDANPNARPLKMLSHKTGECLCFPCLGDAVKHFGVSNKTPLSRRLNGEDLGLWRGEWQILPKDDK